MNEFTVDIEQFNGPLDLMLHLVSEKKLDLMDLDLNLLAEQYIAYIMSWKQLHLEIASEYLVMLAMLIEYKSKQLLPKNQDELLDEYEEDPKEKMIKRLLEYQKFKDVSIMLLELYEARLCLHGIATTSQQDEFFMQQQDQKIVGNTNDLLKAMNRIWLRTMLNKPLETKITIKEISLEDRQLEVRAMLHRLPKTFHFHDLLQDVYDKPMFIATFLAVLDMAKMHELIFHVDEQHQIWLTKGVVSNGSDQ